MKVYVDPSSDIQYASYYIYGLYEIFGKKNVHFSSEYFEQFRHGNHFFAFVILDDKGLKKIIVDFTDDSGVDTCALEWCDVYGKINLELLPKKEDKIILIGPSFGIHIYSLAETIWYASTNLLKAFNRISSKRRFLSDYKSQFNRPQFQDYHIEQSRKDYVFFMASLWKKEFLTNTYRANFIKSCKSQPGLDFEGGFAPRTKSDIFGFEDLTATCRVGMKVYLNKLKQSMVAFNTPAVKACHGWKLAEYLCLGKAIISTPLTRQIPKPSELNKAILYTTGTMEDLTLKINELFSNPLLTKQLENNAKSYFNNYLTPQKVLMLLLDKATKLK